MKAICLHLQPPPRENGSILVVTLLTLATVAGFVALAMSLTTGVSRNVQRSLALREATAIGDASLEKAFAKWRDICLSNPNVTAPTGSSFTGIAALAPQPSDFPVGTASYTVKNFSVVAADETWQPIGNTAVVPRVFGPSDDDYSYFYLASADVIIPTMTSHDATDLNDSGNVVARVRRVFEKARHPITNGMAWFKDDLEIHPGPTFVANGDVHANGTLYTGHASLTLNGKTTFGDSWVVGFKPGDNTHPETPAMPTWAQGRPVQQDQVQIPYGVDITNYHKLIENTFSPPTDPNDPLKTTDAIYAQSFSNPANSGVQIYVSDNSNPNNADTVTIYSGTNPDGSPEKITSGKLYDDVQAAISTNQTITDNREGATTGNSSIRLVTLDVRSLTNSINKDKLAGSINGVVYISDISADPKGIGAKRAIRLKNGAILPTGGLTVASDNPVYIQGDYNTGYFPPSNYGDTTNPDGYDATFRRYNRQPAAVIGDAVNVLSNAWSDGNSGKSIGSRPAVPTTVNTAIISGIVATGNGNYSGGLENFPRFLENWNNVDFTYYGSMLELYTSKQGIGIWGRGGGNVYSPPIRAWYFDNNFLSDPPPGIPFTVDYRRSRWYME